MSEKFQGTNIEFECAIQEFVNSETFLSVILFLIWLASRTSFECVMDCKNFFAKGKSIEKI